MTGKTDSYILDGKDFHILLRSVSNVHNKFQLPLRKRCMSLVKLVTFIYNKCH